MLNIGWFSTGRDEAAQKLFHAVQHRIRSGDIRGRVSFVLSNREPGEAKESDLFFRTVRSYHIPLVCLSHRSLRAAISTADPGDRGMPPAAQESVEPETASDHGRASPHAGHESWRILYDREVDKSIARFSPDICVLAGYMLIVGPELCGKHTMINLHPATPGGPTGTWEEVIRSLINANADTAGAMMHLVTPELDRGPALTYCRFPLRGAAFDAFRRTGDTDGLFQAIREHELAREFPLIIHTLRAIALGEITIREHRVIDSTGRPVNGYDLSSRIEQELAADNHPLPGSSNHPPSPQDGQGDSR